jgi:4-amino-4-deoxy-L-arabinose transferase-like glycosyltransferase
VVVLSLALSPARLLTRAWLLVGLGSLLAAAFVLWQLRGKPRPPLGRPALHAVRDTLRDPVLALLALFVICGLGYSAALMLFTAPNGFDELVYHLPRAALWKQQHAVAYVARASEARINAFPPNAEIGDAFTMIFARNDRFVGLGQLFGLLATMIGIIGIARRLGLDRRQALFGALVFATLPVVALQASTSLNDLVLASTLVGFVFFVLSGTRTGFALASLALGLAVGTKGTAVIVLPLLAAIAVAFHPRARLPALALTVVVGIAIGSVWWVVNLAETGQPAGRFPIGVGESGHLLQRRGAAMMRMAIDAVDPSGSVGRDRWLYALAAVAVFAGGVLAAVACGSRRVLAGALLAAALALVPLAVEPVYDLLDRGYTRLWFKLGYPNLAFNGAGRVATHPVPTQSWYGPLGLLLFLVGAALVIREVRRGGMRRAALLLALAPLPAAVLLALAIDYQIWNGRLLMFSVALASATWGVAFLHRPLAWAAAAVAVSTLVLAFVHDDEKPAGIALLGHSSAVSVWQTSRRQLQHRRQYPDAVEAVAERARPGATIALDVYPRNVSYPFFGSRLDRRVVFADRRGHGLSRADWLVVAPGRRIEFCGLDWRRLPSGRYWRLYRRVGRGRCSA